MIISSSGQLFLIFKKLCSTFVKGGPSVRSFILCFFFSKSSIVLYLNEANEYGS